MLRISASQQARPLSGDFQSLVTRILPAVWHRSDRAECVGLVPHSKQDRCQEILNLSNKSSDNGLDSRTGMLPADSIEKPKIKTKRENSHNIGDQFLEESVEKQRNDTRLKFLQIRHTFQRIRFQNLQ